MLTYLQKLVKNRALQLRKGNNAHHKLPLHYLKWILHSILIFNIMESSEIRWFGYVIIINKDDCVKGVCLRVCEGRIEGEDIRRPPVQWVSRMNEYWRETSIRQGIKCVAWEAKTVKTGETSAVANPLEEVSMRNSLRLRCWRWLACWSRSWRVWKSMRVRVRSSRDRDRAFFSSPKPRWSTLLQLAMLNSDGETTFYIFSQNSK